MAGASALLALAIAAAALGATGALTGQGCIADVGDAAGCGTTQQGLNGAQSVAVSTDGKSAYVASGIDDAIVRFDRDTTTGALTPAGCIADDGSAIGCGATQQGLDGAAAVAVSADGKSVYVASDTDDAIVRFDRDTTSGALTAQGCISDTEGTDTCGATNEAQGLDGASGIAVSADGKSVYVASAIDDAIARFDRETTTGALAAAGCIQDVESAAGCVATEQGLDTATGVAVSPDGKSVYVASTFDSAIVRFDRDPTSGAITPGDCIADVGDVANCGTTPQQGLLGAIEVAVSPDNKSVYVASFFDRAIVRFDRTTSGALTGQGCIGDVGDIAGCGTTQQGLHDATGVAVSPDGRSAYVVSATDHAIARFDRDTSAGALTPQGCIADVGDLAGCGATQQGLNTARAVAVSPDGKSVYAATNGDHAIVRFNRGDSPETQIDSGPPGATDVSTPTFTFSSDEGNVTFECRVDGDAFATCSGPGASHTTATLADGAHSFEVRARDAFGIVDPTPASSSFTVDAPDTPPPDDPTPTDATAPDLELAGKKVQRFRRAVKVEASCADEDCAALAKGTVKVSPPVAGRLATRARAKTFKLKKDSEELLAGVTETLVLKASRKARKAILAALERRQKVVAKVTVTATDSARNSRSAQRKIKLKR